MFSRSEVDKFKGILKFRGDYRKTDHPPRLDISGRRESWAFPKVRDKMLAAGYSKRIEEHLSFL